MKMEMTGVMAMITVGHDSDDDDYHNDDDYDDDEGVDDDDDGDDDVGFSVAGLRM